MAFSSTSSVQVYAHRGARSLAPENTLPAYQLGLSLGCDWVDMDVVLTQDGEVLVCHNLILNPDIVRDRQGHFLAPSRDYLQKLSSQEQAAYNQKYAIKNWTLKDLQQLDVGRLNPQSSYSRYFPQQKAIDGTHMPSLREVIRFVNQKTRRQIGFQIEMKTDPAHPEYSCDPVLLARAVYAILKEEDVVEICEIQAFDFRCLQELQRLDARIKTAYLTSRENERSGSDDFFSSNTSLASLWTGGPLVKDFNNSIPQMIKALGGYAWEPEDAELTQEALKEAHSLGLKVVVWSWPEKLGQAFDPALTTKMIDWGVDGIIIDDPTALITILRDRDIKAPPRFP